MIIPVRCFSCGKVLADKWEHYVRECDKADADAAASSASDGQPNRRRPGPDGKTDRGRILDAMGIHSFCCRTVMLTHIDIVSVI